VAASPTQLLNRHVAIKRQIVVPMYRQVARTIRFYPPPRVCAISLPKSGTHLLTSLLGHLPKMMFSGLHVDLGAYVTPAALGSRAVEVRALRGKLTSVQHGQFMTGHLPAIPEVADALGELEFAILLIVRDPRDVMVSLAHYLASDPSHHFHRRLAPIALPDRLSALITGFPADSTSPGLPPIGDRLALYQPWLTNPAVCVVRFEDLVGPDGEGSRADQIAITKRVADWVRRPLTDEQARRIADRIWSPRSSTFRDGRSGGWRDVFTDDHRRTFDHQAGALMEALGYAR
jgi:sulfotransferase 6B1